MVVKGEKIRALREERGCTLQELSRRAGLSFSYLSEIERGAKKPSLKTLEKIAKALNVTSSQFFAEEQAGPGLSPGERIRLLRGEKKLSLEELARQTGLSPSYLSEIERGAVSPSLGAVQRLARFFGVSPAALLGQELFLGSKLKTLREEQGLTQARLAKEAGVTPGMIGQIGTILGRYDVNIAGMQVGRRERGSRRTPPRRRRATPPRPRNGDG